MSEDAKTLLSFCGDVRQLAPGSDESK